MTVRHSFLQEGTIGGDSIHMDGHTHRNSPVSVECRVVEYSGHHSPPVGGGVGPHGTHKTLHLTPDWQASLRLTQDHCEVADTLT